METVVLMQVVHWNMRVLRGDIARGLMALVGIRHDWMVLVDILHDWMVLVGILHDWMVLVGSLYLSDLENIPQNMVPDEVDPLALCAMIYQFCDSIYH